MEPIRVLLVDDDRAVLKMMQTALESRSFTVARRGRGGSVMPHQHYAEERGNVIEFPRPTKKSA